MEWRQLLGNHKLLLSVQELEREVRQALAAASVGDPTPIRGRPGALLDPLGGASSESSPLTFASSQFSPSAWPALVGLMTELHAKPYTCARVGNVFIQTFSPLIIVSDQL